MPTVWVLAALPAFVVLGLWVFHLRRRTEVVTFGSAREERLTRTLAQSLGCDPAAALPAVRKELDYSPGQSDETLLKRAAYHYRRDRTERTCSAWRDRVPG